MSSEEFHYENPKSSDRFTLRKMRTKNLDGDFNRWAIAFKITSIYDIVIGVAMTIDEIDQCTAVRPSD
jgi:hypothetical protein